MTYTQSERLGRLMDHLVLFLKQLSCTVDTGFPCLGSRVHTLCLPGLGMRSLATRILRSCKTERSLRERERKSDIMRKKRLEQNERFL